MFDRRLRDERLIEDLKLVEVEEALHNIGWTHPEETNTALLDFVSDDSETKPTSHRPNRCPTQSLTQAAAGTLAAFRSGGPVQPGEPQAVLTPITEAAKFLVLTVEAGSEDPIRDVLSVVSSLKRSVDFLLPEGELTCVTGVGSQGWDK
ncbi:MAG: Dyp-type peroxidase domain-containing protein [Solirubrobacteraceae bacterium]